MKFIIDAQLPYQLAKAMQKNGYDAIHTDDLPLMERTTDEEVRQISIQQQRIVITKDAILSIPI
jgi:predicted nuclease of predicted toxin-antitoxin system